MIKYIRLCTEPLLSYLIFRYAMVFTNSFQRLFMSKSAIIVAVFVIVIVQAFEQISFYIVKTLVTMENVDYNILPKAVYYEKDTIFACYFASTPHRHMLYYTIIVYLIAFFLGLFCFSHLTLKMTKMDKRTRTGKLHFMLYKAFAIQLVIGNIMLLMPTVLTLWYLSSMWEDPKGITSICFALIISHGVADFFVMIYFITPWRRRVLRLIRKMLNVKTEDSVAVKRYVNQNIKTILKNFNF